MQDHLQKQAAAKDMKKFQHEVFMNTGQRQERAHDEEDREAEASAAALDLKVLVHAGEMRSRDDKQKA